MVEAVKCFLKWLFSWGAYHRSDFEVVTTVSLKMVQTMIERIEQLEARQAVLEAGLETERTFRRGIEEKLAAEQTGHKECKWRLEAMERRVQELTAMETRVQELTKATTEIKQTIKDLPADGS